MYEKKNVRTLYFTKNCGLLHTRRRYHINEAYCPLEHDRVQILVLVKGIGDSVEVSKCDKFYYFFTQNIDSWHVRSYLKREKNGI